MSTLSRRTFLKGMVALASGAMLYKFSDGGFRIALANANAGPEVYKLRIIHTNDHHARIEPAQLTIKAAAGSTPGAVRNFGGVARRKTVFDQIRADVTIQDKLFLDAGDVFQGTLYFNQYKGAADLFFYNELGYDAMTLGNHEFDSGDQTLADFIGGANFPVVSANVKAKTPSPLAALQVTGNDTPDGKLGERTIVTLPSGEKVGIFGLTTPDTPALASPSADVAFDSALVTVAQAQVDALKMAGVNKVIALTHIGYTADLDLVSKVKGIDLIVGGHSHTPLLPASASSLPLGVASVAVYPQIVKDPDGNDTVVVTDWEWAKWIGDLVVGFDAAGLVTSVSSGSVLPVWADGILDTASPAKVRDLLPNEGAEITANATFQAKIDTEYKPPIDTLRNSKIGVTTVLLDAERGNVRTRETNFGNLIADSNRERILLEKDFNKDNLPVVCLANSGGIRASRAVGDITVGGVLETLPFGNTLATVVLTGAQLKTALENSVSRWPAADGRFAQVSGIRFVFNPLGRAAGSTVEGTAGELAVPGQRIVSVEVAELPKNRSIDADIYQPLVLTANYLVVVNNFILTGGDFYGVLTPAGDKKDPLVGGGKNQLDTGLLLADVVMDYIKAKTPLATSTDGRIQRTSAWLPLVLKSPATREVEVIR